jgi:transcriptional regulator with XRE-family HTH domain
MIYTRNGIPMDKFNRDMLSIAIDVRRLNLKDLHEGTGISLSDLKQINNGIRQPTLDQVKAISEMLGFPLSFFYREGKRYPPLCWHGDNEVEELPEQLSLF